MKVLHIGYALWKQIVTDKALTSYHTVEGTDSVQVCAGSPELIFCADVDPDDYADWQTNFASSTLVPSGDEALANISGLGKVMLRRTPDGTPVSSPSFEDTGGLNPKWEGKLYTATAGALSFFDEKVITEKQLRGGWYELIDAAGEVGDYVEQSVIDKDDVLGYFALYGMTVGVNVLELKKYIKTEYVNPINAGQRQVFAVASTFTLVAGLYLRVAYNSTGTEDVKLKVTTLAYE